MIKIAIPTSDKTSVDEHTGQATFFAIATIQNNSIGHLEFRPNPPHEHNEQSGGHSHHQISELLNDCKVMLVKNIDKDMIAALSEAGIPYEETGEDSIANAIRYYLSEKDTII
jgi:predicted Fe-Mo cluster-binding NifX family protein